MIYELYIPDLNPIEEGIKDAEEIVGLDENILEIGEENNNKSLFEPICKNRKKINY